jgi:YhcH/YjgK/YiaL family protein
MIVDLISHMDKYIATIPSLKTVMEVLQSGKLSNPQPGQYKTDNPKVRYNVFAYETKETEAVKWEIHHKEIDVQILLDGHEKMDCAWPEPIKVITPYNKEIDAEFVSGTTAFYLYAIPKTFVIFTPGEPHAPSLSDGMPAKIMKVVFKLIA